MKNVLIVTAMEEETQGFLKALEEKNISFLEKHIQNFNPIYSFKIGENSCYLTFFGISYFSSPKVSRVIETYKEITDNKLPFDSLILAGTCAGLANQKIGEAFITNNVACADLDLTFFNYIDGTLDKVASPSVGPLLLSGSKFIASKEDVKKVKERFPGVVAFDMESYIISQIAKEYRIPFLSMKAISDNGDEDTATQFDDVVVGVAKCSGSFIISFLNSNTVDFYIQAHTGK